jgi:hypothetical protein
MAIWREHYELTRAFSTYADDSDAGTQKGNDLYNCITLETLPSRRRPALNGFGRVQSKLMSYWLKPDSG